MAINNESLSLCVLFFIIGNLVMYYIMSFRKSRANKESSDEIGTWLDTKKSKSLHKAYLPSRDMLKKMTGEYEDQFFSDINEDQYPPYVKNLEKKIH